MRNVSTSQLQQCASSNVAGLVGTLLAFCLYCYSLKALPHTKCPGNHLNIYRHYKPFDCPIQVLEVSCTLSTLYCLGFRKLCRGTKCAVVSSSQAYTWSIIMLLLLYNIGAIFLHGFLSLSAIKTLKATWNTFLWIQWYSGSWYCHYLSDDRWQGPLSVWEIIRIYLTLINEC